MSTITLIRVVLIVALFSLAACTDSKNEYANAPVHFSDVTLNDSFWAPRIHTNNSVTIRHNFQQCEETGRFDNFEFAAGRKEGVQSGYYFNDTDVYKTIEAAAYALHTGSDPDLETYVDKAIELIAAAQENDGYIYTAKTAFNQDKPAPGGKERWTDIAWGHELYCSGHLYEAAVAYFQATGKKNLLDIALKNADLVCDIFGPGKMEEPPGHQEIEIGLTKLYRVTGDRKYLDMAKYFLDIRGVPVNERALGGEYNQDHKPVREQDEVVGHAVRASYMYAGMADVAAISGDMSYVAALDKLWENAANGKLYITGGYGATGAGESFGDNFELPNMSAYCETCSSIAGMMWNHRMFLLHGDAKYIDVFERTLYNAFLAGVSLDGKNFFYPNPLESVGQHQRTPWFNCACCPPNVARFIASLPGYFYATAGDRLSVNLYAGNTAHVELNGQNITVHQETDYPWDGTIRQIVEPESDTLECEIAFRIPIWARGRPVESDIYSYLSAESGEIEMTLNGEDLDYVFDKGYAVIKRSWRKGDTVEFTLPMPVRRVLAHEKVAADRGRVALERGPLVYCLEWPDAEGGHVRNLLLLDDAQLTAEYAPELFGGVQIVKGKALAHEYHKDGLEILKAEKSFRAIPYYAWAHRGPGEMQVWLARADTAVHPLNEATIASSSSATASAGKYPAAVNDQLEPDSSGDHSWPYFHWWPNKGTKEWIQYDFDGEKEVSIVEVYWFDDSSQGECRIPASWRILYKAGDKWLPVYTTDTYTTEKDQYNKVVFETVKTAALRLEIQSQANFAGGIHECKVK